MSFDNRESIVAELAQTRDQLCCMLVDLFKVEEMIGEAPSMEHLHKLMEVRTEIERRIREKQAYLIQLKGELFRRD